MNNIVGYEETEKKPDVKHNWLYSVVPQMGDTNGINGIYLVAYCKNDRKYVTVRLQTDQMIDFVVQRTVDIPVWGCDPVE